MPSGYITELKEKFHAKDTTKSDRMRILTLLPKNWSTRKTAHTMNTSRFFVAKARNLVEKKGILAIPGTKSNVSILSKTVDVFFFKINEFDFSTENPFPPEIIIKVKQFYERDDVSVMMPGQKDTKSVKIDGKQCIMQKRLIFGNLQDVYQRFIRENEGIKISFSKFCSLRPEHCIFAGTGGTHNVCLCPIHENMRLMTSGNKQKIS